MVNNRLLNLINRNCSAANILKVMSPSTYVRASPNPYLKIRKVLNSILRASCDVQLANVSFEHFPATPMETKDCFLR